MCGTIINLAMRKEGKLKLKTHVTLPSRKWWVTGMPNSPTLASKNCCDVRIFVKVIVYFCFRITLTYTCSKVILVLSLIWLSMALDVHLFIAIYIVSQLLSYIRHAIWNLLSGYFLLYLAKNMFHYIPILFRFGKLYMLCNLW